MKKLWRNPLTAALLLTGLFFSTGARLVHAQTEQPVMAACEEPKLTPAKPDASKDETKEARGGVMLTVKDAGGGEIMRKRFYLLEKNIQETGGIDWKSVPVQKNFYKGASPGLLKWLEEHHFECDTLYCPEYQDELDKARRDGIKEFREAYDKAFSELNKNHELALRWMMVYFPLKNARLGYYEEKKRWVESVAQKAGKVKSVMTDERGVAYFTDIKPGKYYLSNIIPLEKGNVLWNCPVTVGPIPHDKLSSADVVFTVPKPAATATK